MTCWTKYATGWVEGRSLGKQTAAALAKKPLPVSVLGRIQDAHKNRTALEDPAFASLVYQKAD